MLHKGTLCHTAEMGTFLEDKCEPAMCLRTTRARVYFKSSDRARQCDQSTSNFSPQYRMLSSMPGQKYNLMVFSGGMGDFYHAATNLQSYALLQRDAPL